MAASTLTYQIIPIAFVLFCCFVLSFCVCLYKRRYIHVHIPFEDWRTRISLCLSSDALYLYFCRQDLFMFPGTQQISFTSWLARCKDLSVSMVSALELQIHANIPGEVFQTCFYFFSHGFWEVKSDSCAAMTSTLPTLPFIYPFNNSKIGFHH